MVLADCQRSGFRSLRKGQRRFGDATLNSGVGGAVPQPASRGT